MAITCPLCGQKTRDTYGADMLCQSCNALQASWQQRRGISASASAPPRSGRSLAALQSALSEAQQVREECCSLGKDRKAQAAHEMFEMLAKLIWTLRAEQAQREALQVRELPSGRESRATADWSWEEGVTPQFGRTYYVDYEARVMREKPRMPATPPAPRSSFFLHITQPPCFAHGIGGRSYSQICSKETANDATLNLSGLADALESLQASEKWRLGLGEP